MHCSECGTALSDRDLLLNRDLCDTCHEHEQRQLEDGAAEGWWAGDEAVPVLDKDRAPTNWAALRGPGGFRDIDGRWHDA